MPTILSTTGILLMVDDCDYEWISKYTWHVCGGYARRNAKINGVAQKVYMHREIMETPKGKEVDHIDGNPFNNQRINLRNCSHAENLHNQRKTKHPRTSLYKGVSATLTKKWEVYISINGAQQRLGTFETEILAAIAYNSKAQELFGEFACLNTIMP